MRARFLFSILFLGVAGSLSLGLANPTGGSVRSGFAEFDFATPGLLQVTQSSDRAILDWETFSIAAGETTKFVQPGASSASLNRVTSGALSEIHGRLEANGQVFLINPNGILVGANGVVETAGFLASTLDVSDAEFLAGGDLTLSGESAAGVTNLGTIRSMNGDVFLIAKQVVNEGTLSASEGTVGLGGGQDVRLLAAGEDRIQIRPGSEGSVTNRGTIEAITAELEASGGNEMALAINNEGLIRATGATRAANGRILLSSRRGRIRNTGTLSANHADGSGGLIRATVSEAGAIENEGAILAQATTGAGGQVELSAPLLQVGGTINASGVTNGGQVTLAGDQVTLRGQVLANGGMDGGQVRLGGDTRVEVAPGAGISANGGSGDGGLVNISSRETRFSGTLSATGAVGGGRAEITGSEHLHLAEQGIELAGAASLGELTLSAPSTTVIDGESDIDPGDNNLTDGDLTEWLKTSNVTVEALNDANFGQDVEIAWVGHSTFKLSAGKNLNIADAVTIQHHEGASGGIEFTAGNHLNVGGPADRTGGVAVGSRTGTTAMVAGAQVNVTGGDGGGAFSQIGYRTGEGSAIGSRIVIRGEQGVNVVGGTAEKAFAQIGHGGWVGATGGSVENAAIEVTSSEGSIALAGPSDFYGGGVASAGAQIGHGFHLSGESVETGSIIGDLEVVAAVGHVTVNGGLVATGDQIAQIGHGSNSVASDVFEGAISGAIRVSAVGGRVQVGSAIGLAEAAGPIAAESKIGHGGRARLIGEDAVAASGPISGDISVTGGWIDVNSSLAEGGAISGATNQSSIGHGRSVVSEATGSHSIAEGNLVGEIELRDVGLEDGRGIRIESTLSGGQSLRAASRVGHGTHFESMHGSDIAFREAARVSGGLTIETFGAEAANQDILVLGAIQSSSGSEATAIIGHGGAYRLSARDAIEFTRGKIEGDLGVDSANQLAVSGVNEGRTTVANGNRARAQVGHGSRTEAISENGNIELDAGEISGALSLSALGTHPKDDALTVTATNEALTADASQNAVIARVGHLETSTIETGGDATVATSEIAGNLDIESTGRTVISAANRAPGGEASGNRLSAAMGHGSFEEVSAVDEAIVDTGAIGGDIELLVNNGDSASDNDLAVVASGGGQSTIHAGIGHTASLQIDRSALAAATVGEISGSVRTDTERQTVLSAMGDLGEGSARSATIGHTVDANLQAEHNASLSVGDRIGAITVETGATVGDSEDSLIVIATLSGEGASGEVEDHWFARIGHGGSQQVVAGGDAMATLGRLSGNLSVNQSSPDARRITVEADHVGASEEPVLAVVLAQMGHGDFSHARADQRANVRLGGIDGTVSIFATDEDYAVQVLALNRESTSLSEQSVLAAQIGHRYVARGVSIAAIDTVEIESRGEVFVAVQEGAAIDPKIETVDGAQPRTFLSVSQPLESVSEQSPEGLEIEIQVPFERFYLPPPTVGRIPAEEEREDG